MSRQRSAKFNKPVLLVYGDKDMLVPVASSKMPLEQYQNAELVVIEDGGHGFYHEQQVKSCETTIAFIKKNIS